MHAFLPMRLSRALTLVTSSLVLAGCFGQGDGPTPIPGNPAPPPEPLPPGFCDVVNFEDACGPVEFGPDAGFAGGVATVIDNPDPSGINTTEKTAQMQKFAGEIFGGATLERPNGVDFSRGEAFTMKVWASRAVPVLFKLENVSGVPEEGKERALNHSGSGSWEELCFDFTGDTGGFSSDGITFIFDGNVIGDADNNPGDWTFYFDEIEQVDSCGAGAGPIFPVDFEDDPASYDFGTDAGFGGGASDVIANPDQSGLNTTAQTARMQKFAGEIFGGSTLSLGGNVDFSQGAAFKMKVWATRQVPVLFKFDDAVSGDPNLGKERELNHSGSGGWEELCFDFTGDTDGFTSNSITFIFDNGVAGDAANDPDSWTFYYDEIEQVASCGGAGPAPFQTLTFDDPAVTYTLRGFNGAEDSSLQPDPDDAGNTAVRVNRADNADTFAGTVVSTGPNESVGVIPLDAMNTQMNMRVRSPAAGITVRMKIENSSDPAVSVETETATTVGGAWETLTLDFANEVSGTTAFDPNATYDKIVIFFNFGVDGATAGAQTYYFDDVDVGAGSSGGSFPPIDFNDPTITYALRGFNGAEDSSLQPDPADAGNTVVRVNRAANADTFAGTVVSTGPNESVPVIPLDAMNTQMSVRVWSPAAGITVRLKIENSADPAVSVETETVTTVGGAWETLTFNFLNEVSGTTPFDPNATYDKIIIFFNFGVDGATAGAQTFYFDDITVVPGTGGGPGGGPALGPIDFEPNGLGGAFAWTVFENGDNPPLEVIANPDATGANTSATVAQFTARQAGQPFAGAATSDLPTFTLDSSNAIVKIKVWKTEISDVGIKFEDASQGSTGEIKVANTVVNQWEELTFDFSGKIGEPTSTDITALVIFPDFNARAQDNIVYFDDISFSAVGAGGGMPTAVDFEDAGAPYTFGDFNGGAATVIDNPDQSGINTTAKTAQMQKFDGEVFGGSTLTLPAAIDFSQGEAFTMKVWASRQVPVLFKLEGILKERELNHSGSGGWEELCFDFSGDTAGPTSSAITFIFDNGTAGDAANDAPNWTFYFDEIQQVASCPGGGGGTPAIGPVDFEPGGLGQAFAWTVFENDDNPAVTFIANPDASGANTSATVAQFTARVGGQTFAGTITNDLPTFTLDNTNSCAKIKVWKPVISDVGIKFEQANQASTGEFKVANTVTNQWEELTFDFSPKIGEPTSTDITGVILFPDFDARTQDNVIYFDDIAFFDSGQCP